MGHRFGFCISSFITLILFGIGWCLFIAGWGLQTKPYEASKESLVELSRYPYLSHWGVIAIGGLVFLFTLIYILVGTFGKRSPFLKVAGFFSMFFHVVYLVFVGYPIHNYSLCMWDVLFTSLLQNSSNTDILYAANSVSSYFGAGAGCPEAFNLYFLFSGSIVSIFFLGLTMMITYLTPLMPLGHPYARGDLKRY